MFVCLFVCFCRHIYWTDWGYNPKIERAGMDGDPSTRQTIVRGNLGWPNGLTIDYTNKRLYWADARLKKIETSNYDGTDRQLVASITPHHPFALATFENHLYYSDWFKFGKAIRKINKFSGGEKSLVKATLWSYMDISVYHPLRQPNGTITLPWALFGWFNLLNPNSWSNVNFSFQFIAVYVWFNMEKLAGDLLLGSKFVRVR